MRRISSMFFSHLNPRHVETFSPQNAGMKSIEVSVKFKIYRLRFNFSGLNWSFGHPANGRHTSSEVRWTLNFALLVWDFIVSFTVTEFTATCESPPKKIAFLSSVWNKALCWNVLETLQCKAWTAEPRPLWKSTTACMRCRPTKRKEKMSECISGKHEQRLQ